MNIALLSFHFHNATAEGLVTTKLARALIDRGHQVTVFTSHRSDLCGDVIAPSSGPLAGIIIYRVGNEITQVPKLWRFLAQRSAHNPLWDKGHAVLNLMYGCSPEEWAWVCGVSNQITQVMASEGPFDILHTRLNHAVSHLAGLQVISQLPDLPWCAYFSDPWPHHLYPEPYHFNLGLLSQIRLEQILDQILRKSGSCVFPSQRLLDYMLIRKRQRFAAKSFVIPHLSYDWDSIRVPAPSSVLRIRHAGFLMKERRIDSLYDGLRRFLQGRPEAREQICIEFAGRYVDNELPQAPTDLEGVIQFLPHIPAEAIRDWMQEADVLLLVEAKMQVGIFFPSKLADYLRGQRPIFALSPRVGVTADFLRRGGGLVVEPDDAEAIGKAIASLYQKWQTDQLYQLVPTPEQANLVSPAHIIPLYEEAFQHAMKS